MDMAESGVEISAGEVAGAVHRVCDALQAEHEFLLGLDQQMGDGDLGITLTKIAAADREFTNKTPVDDIGKYLSALGMETNKAGQSTMGTLLATALIRAGKEVKGQVRLTPETLTRILTAADLGIQERGKAKLGDKTIVDALHPAVEAWTAAVAAGEDLRSAARKMVFAAEAGRDHVTPFQSRIGRASWVGERTMGLVDPGCAALVIILRAIVGE